MSYGQDRLVDLTMKRHHETEKAILVSDDDPDEAVWLPKSQIEIDYIGEGYVTITIPEWLALEKGLI